MARLTYSIPNEIDPRWNYSIRNRIGDLQNYSTYSDLFKPLLGRTSSVMTNSAIGVLEAEIPTAATRARIPGEVDRLARSSGRAACVVGRRVEDRVVPWTRHAAQHAPSVPSPPHRGPTSPFAARPRHPNYPLTTCRAAPAASAQAPGFELAGGPAGAPQAPWLTQTPTARLSVGLRAPRKVRAAASTDLDPSGARPSR